MEPADFEYGEQQYSAQDPFGHQRTFSDTLTGPPPKHGAARRSSDDQRPAQARSATSRQLSPSSPDSGLSRVTSDL